MTLFVLTGFYRQSAVDLNIAFQVSSFAFTMIQLLGIIAVMCQVAWQVALVFIPVILACIWYEVNYFVFSVCYLDYQMDNI